ncbi:AraC family transcriptional regulator [Ancylobacter dichloromethanicus]|uniref:AraC family transcriptional regulator n=2 Tax=Ancylobacter dichloromethanicus TaxID=518825 RepID=A0A9W6MXJ9_9HYPH|nr:helix-turn-helix transcriptional regulator [Ancylobacter dichloromethanicus]MBS7555931.1 AraC family transcriptional regulator [Ancylobacter dichloromethanicus]GLK70153.1 AraC family transcriptional regulator [Ancylobacter dichloromethanicus]
MIDQPLTRISHTDLEEILFTLEVDFVDLFECVVGAGWKLEMLGSPAPGMHYNISGGGRLIIAGRAPIALEPHTLVIVPAQTPLVIEGPPVRPENWQTVRVGVPAGGRNHVERLAAGDGTCPQVMLVCGYVRASYAGSLDLFAGLSTPIIEKFDETTALTPQLEAVVVELIRQEIGMKAMTATLLKEVLIVLLRRSMTSMNEWVERLSLLQSPQIARAFSDMAARPEFAHSVQSLAQSAGLSRSAFMARFQAVFGTPPMTTLRQIRMRHAASLLAIGDLSVDQVGRIVGYNNRSGFSRVFRKTYGADPSEYRAHKRQSR